MNEAILDKLTTGEWLHLIHEIGPEFENRAVAHDDDDSFVFENYETLKEHGFFGAMIPEDFGGGGVAYSTVADLLRTIAQYCGSTALAVSMHQHLVAATIWKSKHGSGGAEVLKNVAANQKVLVSTGANDWLESSGEAVRAEGGYRVTAIKPFASQSAAADVLVTSAPCKDAVKGWQVLHFSVPLNSDGVTVLNDWRALGMRATGSHSVRLDNVFIPESRITLERSRGVFHPVFNVVAAAAMPLVMSVYVGIAQKAARIAIKAAKAQQRPKPHLASSIGGMINELTSAELHVKDMIRLTNDLDFKPDNQLGQDILSRKTNAANACINTVTKAMDIAGGQGFYRGFGLERLFRDIQAAKYHPLPQPDQQQSLGEYILKADGPKV